MASSPTRAASARAFAPASVGNIGVGFDLLGHTIDGPRDHATVVRIAEPTVRIDAIHGDAAVVARLPREPSRNTAGRALQSLRAALGLGHGFAITLEKGIPLGSGFGGSAASCVAALVAANALLDDPLPQADLYPFALDGESVASDSRQGDNVGPMLLGGIALATVDRLLPLPCPAWLHAVVVHPDQVLETRASRAVLSDPFPLSQVVAHAGHLALFLSGLYAGDAALLRAGLRDVLVEPRRAALVPGFADAQAAALARDALGSSLSGAGPSVFAWFASRVQAEAAAPAMTAAFTARGIAARAYVSPVAGPHAALVD